MTILSLEEVCQFVIEESLNFLVGFFIYLCCSIFMMISENKLCQNERIEICGFHCCVEVSNNDRHAFFSIFVISQHPRSSCRNGIGALTIKDVLGKYMTFIGPNYVIEADDTFLFTADASCHSIRLNILLYRQICVLADLSPNISNFFFFFFFFGNKNEDVDISNVGMKFRSLFLKAKICLHGLSLPFFHFFLTFVYGKTTSLDMSINNKTKTFKTTTKETKIIIHH
ncbi:hypothetical protein RFI_27764 [Reticulomyxa filosa]|uniref:Uncharacterized protein n=1 Tax=Reticulomyxa filosa TaxID=46433 RepID=X6M6S2_RETFI|nr:hypothetical protein RFI_27764 [Reticulomyxa filosa]|eukprot:ETO09614.1 hypothetical protein RFI_27764 [Reticulomyxa filosa]